MAESLARRCLAGAEHAPIDSILDLTQSTLPLLCWSEEEASPDGSSIIPFGTTEGTIQDHLRISPLATGANTFEFIYCVNTGSLPGLATHQQTLTIAYTCKDGRAVYIGAAVDTPLHHDGKLMDYMNSMHRREIQRGAGYRIQPGRTEWGDLVVRIGEFKGVPSPQTDIEPLEDRATVALDSTNIGITVSALESFLGE